MGKKDVPAIVSDVSGMCVYHLWVFKANRRVLSHFFQCKRNCGTSKKLVDSETRVRRCENAVVGVE